MTRPGQAADLAMCGIPTAPNTEIPAHLKVVGEDRRRRHTPAQERATDQQIADAIVEHGRTGGTV